uniref:Uncharacterized protein n=1 Tax=viral metagenome TaxID=1070528 RepID=A0A6M3IFQ1_9ZZZZ
MEILTIEKKVLALDKDEIEKLRNCLLSCDHFYKDKKFPKYMIYKLEELET